MRKFFTLTLLALVGLISSCSKDRLESNPNGNSPVDFRITTTLPSSMLTKSTDSALGGVGNVNNSEYKLRYICEVWTKESTPRLAYRGVKTTTDFGIPMEFSASLLQMKYDFVFWADFVETAIAPDSEVDLFYQTNNADGLKDIQIMGDYGISDDARDAYYAAKTIDLSVAGANVTGITLKRPFGKIRIVASDTPDKPLFVPKSATVKYSKTSLPGGFNALSGKVTDREITIGDVAFRSEVSEVNKVKIGGVEYAKCYLLAYDYIFASESMSSIAFTVKTFSNDDCTNKIGEREISAVPVAANSLTTVIGNLYTVEGKVEMIVTDPFDGDNVTLVADIDVKDITAVNTALVGAANSVSPIQINVTEPVSGTSNDIVIPNPVLADNTPTIAFNFKSIAAGTTINITDETPDNATNNYDGNLHITVPDGTQLSQLSITTSKAHVTIYGSYGRILAQTSPSTFVVPVGTKVDNLTVAGGNVEIYGAVTSIERAFGNADSKTIVYLFDNVIAPTKSDAQIEFVRVVSGAIQNITQGSSHNTLKEAIDAASAGDVIELSNGSYPLTVDPVKVKSNLDDYLRIDKSLTIRGAAVGEVIIYGETVVNGGNGSTQSTIFVGNNAHVTFDNITFMPHVNTYYAPGNTNKTIEVLAGAKVDAINCKFVPNTKVSEYTTTGGSLYFAQSTGTIDGCLFNKASFSVDGLMSGTLNVKNCTFDKGFISTVNWTPNDVAKSTMVVNVSNSKFINTHQATVDENRIVRATFGTININKCTFPDSKGVYTQVINFGKVYVNYAGNLLTDWINDRTQPQAFTIANDLVTMTNNNSLSQNQTFYSWQGRKTQPKSAVLSAGWEIETSLKVVNEPNSAKSVWLYVEDNNGGKYYLSLAYIHTPDKTAGWYVYNPANSATSATWYLEWDEAEVSATTDAFNTVKFVAKGSSIDMIVNETTVSTYALDEGVTASRVIDVTFNSRNVDSSVDYTSIWTYPTLK